MNVVGLCGASGAGKTRLAEGLVRSLRAAGCTVSVVKHTHKPFEVDQPGKDSHRHRTAGAFEVLVANRHRLALIRELDPADAAVADGSVHDLLRELSDLGAAHWVLVEGFKHADLPRIEVWRAARPAPLLSPDDPFVVAVATIDALPQPVDVPSLDLDDAPAVARFLLAQPGRFHYATP